MSDAKQNRRECGAPAILAPLPGTQPWWLLLQARADNGRSSRFIAFAGSEQDCVVEALKARTQPRRSARSCRRPGGLEGRAWGTAW